MSVQEAPARLVLLRRGNMLCDRTVTLAFNAVLKHVTGDGR